MGMTHLKVVSSVRINIKKLDVII